MSPPLRIETLTRVEGHGAIAVEYDGDRAVDVRFDVTEGIRLFESILRKRSYEDLPPFISRICAICSAAHTLTALKAIEQAFEVRVSEQTEALRELLMTGGNIASHALHIFFLAVPDYLGVPDSLALARSHPELLSIALRLKAVGNAIQETIGGRAVHPVRAVPGGFSSFPDFDDLLALKARIEEGIRDARTALDFLAGLPDPEPLPGSAAFLALRSPTGKGYYAGDQLVVQRRPDVRLAPISDYRQYITEDSPDHSHARHSRVDEQVFMVGALARLETRARPHDGLAERAMNDLGLRRPFSNPFDNNKAQMVELAGDFERAGRLVQRLMDEGIKSEEPADVRPRAAHGTAGTEAPRGLLVHSYEFDEEGLVTTADVITPTAMNAASIEEQMREVISRTPRAPEGELRARLEMLVRAYDPCISCSVHMIRI